MTSTAAGRTDTHLSQIEINCLKSAAGTFGHRTYDNYATFKSLEKNGLVYETVRAFYLTKAGKAALAAAKPTGAA